MGSVYKRGKTYWIKYYQNGKPVRESAQSSKKMVAQRLLARREADIAQGKVPNIHLDKVDFDQLANDFLNDYRINQKKSLVRAERSVGHLRRYFGNYKAPQITTPKIKEYILQRLEEVAANATINRELAALKRMLNLGAQQTPPLVDRVPHIPMLRENNVRKGFFEHSEFIALRDALPEYLKGFVTFAYKTGWRLTEIETLKWSQVDIHQGIVRLEAGETKNDEGRTVYLDSELEDVIFKCWENRKTKQVLLPYVFLNQKCDDRIKRFDKAWRRACRAAGVGPKLFHDLRRTAVRNMTRAGVVEQVAMKISGHKSRSVFERYNITNDADLREASKKQEAYINSVTGTNLGTIHSLKRKKG